MNTEKLITRREKALKKELAQIGHKKQLAVAANQRIKELNKIISKAQTEIDKIHKKLGISPSGRAIKGSRATGKRKKYRRTTTSDIFKLIEGGLNSYEKLLAKTKVSRASLYKHLKALSRKISINNKIRPAVISVKK